MNGWVGYRAWDESNKRKLAKLAELQRRETGASDMPGEGVTDEEDDEEDDDDDRGSRGSGNESSSNIEGGRGNRLRRVEYFCF